MLLSEPGLVVLTFGVIVDEGIDLRFVVEVVVGLDFGVEGSILPDLCIGFDGMLIHPLASLRSNAVPVFMLLVIGKKKVNQSKIMFPSDKG